MRIYGQIQNANGKKRPVNANLHAQLMIASRPGQNVKRNAKFARWLNMNYFTMLSSLSMSRNEMGNDHVINQKCITNLFRNLSLLHLF